MTHRVNSRAKPNSCVLQIKNAPYSSNCKRRNKIRGTTLIGEMPTLRRFHAVALLTGACPVRAYLGKPFGAAARERVSVEGASLPCTYRQVSEGA